MDNKKTTEIDLLEVFGQIWNNIVIVILSTVLGALLLYFISNNLMENKYQSSTKIYVLNQQEGQAVTYTDLQTGTQISKDYTQLVKSRTVATKVIAELDLNNVYPDMKNITPDKLAEMITVTAQQDTRIIQITVTDNNPTRAQDIANAVRNAAATHISSVMDIEAVNVVDYANLPEGPVSPKPVKNAIIGALLGFVLSVAVIIVIFLMDDTIKTPDDVERYLGLSVLASIPYDAALAANDKKKKKIGSGSVAAGRLKSAK